MQPQAQHLPEQINGRRLKVCPVILRGHIGWRIIPVGRRGLATPILTADFSHKNSALSSAHSPSLRFADTSRYFVRDIEWASSC